HGRVSYARHPAIPIRPAVRRWRAAGMRRTEYRDGDNDGHDAGKMVAGRSFQFDGAVERDRPTNIYGAVRSRSGPRRPLLHGQVGRLYGRTKSSNEFLCRPAAVESHRDIG